MNNDNKYNGWTNYATWRINLEIFDGMNVDNFSRCSDHYELSSELRAYVESLLLDTSSEGLATDYAMAFISDVNWYEIAEHVMPEEEEEEEEEEGSDNE